MKTYRFKLRPLTPWSTPWQADTIFGSLCWEMLRLEGQDALRRFLQQFDADEPPFIISDALPDGWFPRPLFLQLHQLPGLNFKAKMPDWLAEDQFRQSIREPGKLLPQSCWPELMRSSRELHASIDRFYGGTGGEGNLFEVQQWSFQKEVHRDSRQLCLYVKTRHSLALVTSLIRALATSGFGKKKSVGRGAFELTEEAQPCEWMDGTDGANGFISLSHFVPAPADPIDGVWDLLTKYPKYGANAPSRTPFKGRLTLLRPGSAFRVREDVRPFYGKLLRNLDKDYPDPVHYGLAFAVPMRWPQA
ncbi:MAG: hypothetical protein DMG65_19210 [Candidatus Angelobacter sp. Gp1-AA117]|nr:MAG: hypothetical protein DMG65_19210 [Candidatus Angelobacter sp. Gp1-AA117]